MTDDDRQKTAEQPRTDPAVSGGGASRADALDPDAPTSLTERPEVLAGAAFAGAFLVARILKRLVD